MSRRNSLLHSQVWLLTPRIHAVLLILLVHCGLLCNSQGFGPPGGGGDLDLWQAERPKDMANIVNLEVMCGKSHMEVSVTFDRQFNGIIFSKGAVDRYNCIYVKPQSGSSFYKFDIQYDQCGSKPDLNGRFYENNIVIQYDKDLIEVWDEAKRLRCEWYNDYEKGVTKPPIVVSDLEVVELNFRGDNVDCWMEIQQGKGPWASPVTGIVPLGTTLTMVVGIDDKEGEFDMRVKSCSASDNQNRPIDLSDQNGCVLRPKMISQFKKMRSSDPRATVVTYAFFHAFKFPDSMAVHIKCKVEICRFGCPEHCQSPNAFPAREQTVSNSVGSYSSPSQNTYGSPPVSNNIDSYGSSNPGNPFASGGSLLSGNFQNGKRRSDIPLPPAPPAPPAAPRPPAYRPDPRTKSRSKLPKGLRQHGPKLAPGGQYAPPQFALPKPPPHLPQILPRPQAQVQIQIQEKTDQEIQESQEKPRDARDRSDLDDDEGFDSVEAGEPKGASPVFPDFLGGLKLPKLPSLPSLPFFGSPKDKTARAEGKSDSFNGKAIPVNLGVKPELGDLQGEKPSSVPVHRTLDAAQPLVFPSSFNTADSHVQPIEPMIFAGQQIPYGPRAFHTVNAGAGSDRHVVSRKRRAVHIHSRDKRSADVGVQSGYEVVSEVDLDFSPTEDDRTIATFQGKMREDVVYGVCLPATGFSALFVLFALMTVVSVIVSGFICYHRQLAKVAEESAPEPGGPIGPGAQASFMLKELPGFNTWFRNSNPNNNTAPVKERPPIFRH